MSLRREPRPGRRNRAPSVDIAEVRQNLGLSQEAFAARYGFSISSIRNWEEGASEPYEVARILLAVIASRPDVVDSVLFPHQGDPLFASPRVVRRSTPQRPNSR